MILTFLPIYGVGLLLIAPLAMSPLQRSELPASISVPCPSADGPADDISYPVRKLAFDALAAGDQVKARRLMRCALRVRPGDLAALKQIVHLDLNAGDEGGAIEDIDLLRAFHASEPRFEAQEGYIFFGQKRYP